MGMIWNVPAVAIAMLCLMAACETAGKGVSGSAQNARKLLQGLCGPDAVCAEGDCCSEYGYCGSTNEYCGAGCQPAYGSCFQEPGSDPAPIPVPDPAPIPGDGDAAFGVGKYQFACVFIGDTDVRGNTNTPDIVDAHWTMFKTAADAVGFAGFQNDNEAATFFGNVKHEYGGFLDNMVENCYRTTNDPNNCPCYDPCPEGGPNNYFGRGPLQLTHKRNYEAMSQYVGVDLGVDFASVADPNLDISWRTAIAFWSAPDFNCQGSWVSGNPPTCPQAAQEANLAAVTYRINGVLECGKDPIPEAQRARVDTIQGVFTSCFGLPNPTQNAFC